MRKRLFILVLGVAGAWACSGSPPPSDAAEEVAGEEKAPAVVAVESPPEPKPEPLLVEKKARCGKAPAVLEAERLKRARATEAQLEAAAHYKQRELLEAAFREGMEELKKEAALCVDRQGRDPQCLALLDGDSSRCRDLKDPSLRDGCLDFAALTKAWRAKDPALCSDMVGGGPRELCRGVLGSEMNCALPMAEDFRAACRRGFSESDTPCAGSGCSITGFLQALRSGRVSDCETLSQDMVRSQCVALLTENPQKCPAASSALEACKRGVLGEPRLALEGDVWRAHLDFVNMYDGAMRCLGTMTVSEEGKPDLVHSVEAKDIRGTDLVWTHVTDIAEPSGPVELTFKGACTWSVQSVE